MNRRFVTFALLVVLTLVAAPLFAAHSWSTYHWSRPSGQVTPEVVMNISSAWQPYASRVMTDWNASQYIESPWRYGAISSTKRCTSATGKIEVCNNTYGQNGWLGIAGISLSSGHIIKGYTKLNDTYYNNAAYNTPAWRRMVFCQEVGHDYGLGHVNETFTDLNTGSCMDYTNDPSGTKGTNGTLSNEYPNSHDYSQLAVQYTRHICAPAASLPFDDMVKDATRPETMAEILNKAGQWGEPIAFDQEGRPTTFFVKTGPNHKDHGLENGELMDIFWAPVDPFTEADGVEKGDRHQ
ncbi:MAG TPA: hypothetical protein VF266_27180 [Thermoanaerobaculia bacterium]